MDTYYYGVVILNSEVCIQYNPSYYETPDDVLAFKRTYDVYLSTEYIDTRYFVTGTCWFHNGDFISQDYLEQEAHDKCIDGRFYTSVKISSLTRSFFRIHPYSNSLTAESRGGVSWLTIGNLK